MVNYDFSTGADSQPLAEPQGATGYVVTDTLSWGDDNVNLTVTNQTFVLCDTMAEILDVMPIDGIMGSTFCFLPPPPHSQLRTVTGPTRLTCIITKKKVSIKGLSASSSWYWHLVADGQLDSPYYSFYIPPGDITGGEVTLGGIDETKYTGDLTWTNCPTLVTETFESYVLDQYAIYANGVLLTNGTTSSSSSTPMPEGWAILDTGTAFMQTPDYETAKNMYAQISPNITQIDAAGAWGAPCAELEAVAPDLTFTLGGAAGATASSGALNVTIPKASFNLGEYPGLDGICQALFNNPSDGIGGSWFLDGTAYWLVGSPLLKQYYTVWDGQGLKIGWAQIEGGPGF